MTCLPYFVYIILCRDGTYYTGYTRNIEERVHMHINGRGAKYTRSHPPKEIVPVDTFVSRSEAMRRERSIKRMSHQQKKQLFDLCALNRKESNDASDSGEF